MKSKIIYSVFVLLIFLFGLLAGFTAGVVNSASPIIGQLWAGAIEMQNAISLIDKNEPAKARNLLCNSIQTRLAIMEGLQPIQNETTANNHKKIESYLYGDIEKDRAQFNATCNKP